MPHRPTLQLVTDSYAVRPALSTAVSRAVLLRVAAGELPDTLRVHRPAALVAFGRVDAASPGYADAVRAARAGGFEAVERLAGGRGAVFHEDTIEFAHAVAAADPRAGTHERYREMAAIIAAALRRLGVDARVGEIPGEYCSGAYSVNARGRTKLMGIGQRLVRGAAHVGGVIVVAGSARVRDVLVPVYDALGLSWDPATAGSVEDEVGSVAYEAVEQALLDELATRYELVEAALDTETLALARRFEPEHLPALEATAAA